MPSSVAQTVATLQPGYFFFIIFEKALFSKSNLINSSPDRATKIMITKDLSRTKGWTSVGIKIRNLVHRKVRSIWSQNPHPLFRGG